MHPLPQFSSVRDREHHRDEATTCRITEVAKSPEDSRDYRVIVLPNKLQCLLIVDNESREEAHNSGDDDKKYDARRCAVCMSVCVGHFSDPDEIPGLAHFLEHMLFLGTKKYPSENAWESFISEHGGWSNAATDAETTNYHFEVSPPHLYEALDRFAQFFIAPLFSANGTQREMNAVDSEFQGYLQSDDVRRQEVQCRNYKPDHPASKFGWGNLKTLDEIPKEKGLDVRKYLLEFHHRYYRADAMTLCVIGTDMEELEHKVRELFSQVPENDQGHSLPEFSSFGSAFGEDCTRQFFHIVPVVDRHSLEICFPIPCLQSKYKVMATEFIGEIIGHEGIGSLLSLLREKGWVNEIDTGVPYSGYDQNTSSWVFSISLSLTEQGVELYKEVVGYVFQFIRLLQNNGIPRWLYDEQKQLSEISFRFRSKSEPIDCVQALADSLHVLPAEDILVGSEVYLEYDAELVTSLLEKMTPKSCRIEITSKTFSDTAELTEPWFGATYSKQQIPDDLIEQWTNPPEIDQTFALPIKNQFIADDFTLLGDRPTTPDVPKLVVDSKHSRIYYKLDTKFRLPKMNVFLTFETPVCYESPEAYVLCRLFPYVLADALKEYLYAACLAGLSYSIDIVRRGVELRASGFNDKMFYFIEQIVKKIADLDVTPERFEVLKERQVRAFKNMCMDVKKHAQYVRLLVVQSRRLRLGSLLEAAKNTTLESYQRNKHRILKASFLEGFVHGNVTEKQTVDMAESIQKILNWSELPRWQRHLERIVELEVGRTVSVSAPSRNADESNSAVEICFQIGECTVENQTALYVINHIMWEPFFDHLRTKEQLGYDVSCQPRNTNGVLEFSCSITFAAFSAKHVRHRIEVFLSQTFPKILAEMTKAEYDNHVNSMVMERQYPFNNLGEHSACLWDEIECHQFVWDRKEQEVKLLKSIVLTDVIKFYRRYICLDPKDESSCIRRLCVEIIGQASEHIDVNAAGDEEKHENKNYEKKTKQSLTSTDDTKNRKTKVLKTELKLSLEDIYDFTSSRPLYPDFERVK